MAIQTRCETAVATNGALVEVATIIHEGREFAAQGSVIDPAGGVLVGYVSNGALTTWGGQKICDLQVTGHSRGFNRATITHYAGVYEGRRYHGKNGPLFSLITMRAGRTVSK